ELVRRLLRPESYRLSLHDALPIYETVEGRCRGDGRRSRSRIDERDLPEEVARAHATEEHAVSAGFGPTVDDEEEPVRRLALGADDGARGVVAGLRSRSDEAQIVRRAPREERDRSKDLLGLVEGLFLETEKGQRW